jgi:DNA-binding transcriptional MerR regulator
MEQRKTLDLHVGLRVYRRYMTTYRVTELARRTGITPATLRFYEQAGLLAAERSASGYRLFGEDAVERLEFIASAKRLGLALAEIREVLDVREDGACADVKRQLRPVLGAKITGVLRHAEVLSAFAGRLRMALDLMNDMPRQGRCEPGCCVPAAPADDAPEGLSSLTGVVSGTVSVAPAFPLAPAFPVACTLPGPDQTERIRQWRRLLAQATHRERSDGAVRIGLPMSAAATVAELAAAEQRCCPFISFTLHLAGQSLTLEVRAPAEAMTLLARILGEDPDPDGP